MTRQGFVPDAFVVEGICKKLLEDAFIFPGCPDFCAERSRFKADLGYYYNPNLWSMILAVNVLELSHSYGYIILDQRK